MKNTIFIIITALFIFSCGKNSTRENIFVADINELNQAIKQASPGSKIVLANGVWKDVQIKFYGEGTQYAPITLSAETPGEVFIEGLSNLHLAGDYLVVEGFYFRNGYSPNKGIIRYKIGNDSMANHTRVTNCVIEDFTRPNRWENDRWIEFYGKNNQMDHCYVSGKANDGVTLMVYHDGNKNTNNHHQIDHNYFGPRPRKGGPRAETIRTGGSETSMTPGQLSVSDNYFEACNGEVEIISDKTNFNSFTNNIFYKCEGSLVLRHSNYATVNGNIFIGGDESDFYGGIRVVNTGHWITNNYLYKIRGEEFRTPLAIMNGIPRSGLNRYKQVTDVVVAYNTWVDCRSPWQFGVGQNKASEGVLPASEIRSAPPIRTTVANNLIYNTQADATPLVNHDDISGILFKDNVLDNNGIAFNEFGAFENARIKMKKINEWLYIPETSENDILNTVFNGYDFERIQKDLFGVRRKENNKVGAITQLAAAEAFVIDKSKYGPDWFKVEKEDREAQVFSASSKEGELAQILEQAQSGDIIELSDEVYKIATPLKIDKEITLRAKGETKTQLIFSGEENSVAFEMNPKGIINLKNLNITSGNKNQLAFAPLKENMFFPYKLNIDDCTIEGFNTVLEATYGSFADSINVRNSSIQNCENGFVLAADEKGDYNAEMVTFTNCEFKNIQNNVIYFYRGGYDESTIGGFLKLKGNTFTSCGAKDKTNILIKTPGIINVHIFNNTFKNNPVSLVASLWGAKNNHHKNNTLIHSGKIQVEEQQKLEILY